MTREIFADFFCSERIKSLIYNLRRVDAVKKISVALLSF